MKLTVSKVDVQVEGEASEIREALPAVLAANAPAALPAPVFDDAPLMLEAGDTPATEVVEAEELIRTAADHVIDPDAIVEDVPDAPVPSGGYDDWRAVPTSRRVWGSGGTPTLHVATEPEGLDLFCSHTVGGLRRARNWSPVPMSLAAVCQSCNRHIGIEARP